MDDCKVLIPEEDIQTKVNELARSISNDYEGQNPLLLTLLKGSFIFLADLVRCITIPHEVEFIKLSSYRNGLRRSREVKIIDRLRSDISGRDILIVDGIVDTGHTLCRLIETLADKGARSIKICTLLDKPCSREVSVPIDYVGFTIPDSFVIGYGLDYNERYRNLAYIATLPTGAGQGSGPVEAGSIPGEKNEGPGAGSIRPEPPKGRENSNRLRNKEFYESDS